MAADSSAGGTRLTVKVTPNAGRNAILGYKDGVFQAKIAAPPEKGKANKELVDFLSEVLSIRKSAVSIIKGHTSRNKVININGLVQEEVLKRLST